MFVCVGPRARRRRVSNERCDMRAERRRRIWLCDFSHLCAPETECYRPASTVADFLGKEARTWVVLKKEAMSVV